MKVHAAGVASLVDAAASYGTTRVPLALSLDVLQRMEISAYAATPGPWESDRSGVWTVHPDALCGPVLNIPVEGDPLDGVGRVADPYPRGLNSPTENMAHVATAHPDAVLALVHALRGALRLAGAGDPTAAAALLATWRAAGASALPTAPPSAREQ